MKTLKLSSKSPKSDPGAGRTLVEVAQQFQAAYDARNYREARRHLETMTAMAPEQPQLKFALAQLVYKKFREHEAPMRMLHELLAENPRFGGVHEFLSSIHLHLGDKEKTVEHALQGIELDPTQAICYQNIVRVRPERGPELEPKLLEVLKRPDVKADRIPFLHATLGKIYDDAAEYDKAFHHFTMANKLRRSDFNLDSTEFLLNEARDFFTPEFFSERKSYGLSDEHMVFIVGLPRSGSTLLEQVISAHPDASSAGERHDLAVANAEIATAHQALYGASPNGFRQLQHLTPSLARKAGRGYLERIAKHVKDPQAARWIDKMPGNFAQIGLIALLFPKARILHTRRNLLDVALSCYMQVFDEAHPYSEDLMIFAHYAIIYQEFMKRWRELFGDRIVDVEYEALASNLEGEAPRIIDHLGLPWDDACARPHENRGLVSTASAAQVRQPVYTSSIGRWKNYATHLQPLMDVLEEYERINAQEAA